MVANSTALIALVGLAIALVWAWAWFGIGASANLVRAPRSEPLHASMSRYTAVPVAFEALRAVLLEHASKSLDFLPANPA